MEEMETQGVFDSEDLDLELEDHVLDEDVSDDEDFDDLEDEELEEGLDEETLDETAAADTLKPGAGSGGSESKAQMLATFTALAAQLGKEDLSKFFNDMQSQFGANKAPGATDNSAKNKASINAKASDAKGSGGAAPAEPMPKLSVKEDIDEMFASDETLTEDFKEKAEVIFEAAVQTRITLETARLEEQYAQKEVELAERFEADLAEAIDTSVEEITEQLDKYLNYITEQWMSENKLAIENTLRTEISENFIAGLQNLFAEHYITVPDEKIDLVAELKMELDETRAKLEEAVDANIELETIIESGTKEVVFESLSESLAETQVEKFRSLAEGIEYVDEESYRKKLAIIKENYFPSSKKPATSTGLITESIDGETGDAAPTAYVAPHMGKYVDAIAKAAK